MVPLIDLKIQHKAIANEVEEAIKRVCENTAFILSDEMKQFEAEFASYCGVKHGIGVANGTDALFLALLACGVGVGDEVLVPANTFIASASVIAHVGAKPIFVDCDPETYCIDVKKIPSVLSSNTKALIAVHLYGHPADMDSILEITKSNGIKVIEDCAQAHGTKYKGKHIGGFGDVAGFSFYPSKSLGAYGDAGIVVTNSDEIKDKLHLLRDNGRTSWNEHSIIGYNSRLDGIQAAVLRIKLKHLDEYISGRRAHAQKYAEMLGGIDSIILPTEKESASHSYYVYVVRVKNREAFMASLKEKGCGCGIHYPIPLHLQPAFAYLGGKKGDCPVAEQFAEEIVSIPMFPELTDDQIAEVADSIKKSL